jgi:hypothetical protein
MVKNSALFIFLGWMNGGDLGMAGGLLPVILYLLMTGHGWARYALLILFANVWIITPMLGLGFVDHLVANLANWSKPSTYMAMSMYLTGTIFLFTKDVNRWFDEMKIYGVHV